MGTLIRQRHLMRVATRSGFCSPLRAAVARLRTEITEENPTRRHPKLERKWNRSRRNGLAAIESRAHAEAPTHQGRVAAEAIMNPLGACSLVVLCIRRWSLLLGTLNERLDMATRCAI
jgi:hypothetical protein